MMQSDDSLRLPRSDLSIIRDIIELNAGENDKEEAFDAIDRLQLDMTGKALMIATHRAQIQEQEQHRLAMLSQHELLNMWYTELYNERSSLAQAYTSCHQKLEQLSAEYNEQNVHLQAAEASRHRLAEEIQKQSLELDAAYRSARELGNVVNTFIGADDYSSDSFRGLLDVADMVLRNEYKDVVVEDNVVEQNLENLESSYCPDLSSSATSLQSTSANSAIQAWLTYREEHPLQSEDGKTADKLDLY